MYYPHIYRTLNGREGGKDGLPVKYDQVSLGNIALYNLDQDIGETTNVASDHPEIVNRLSQYGDAIRLKLGDNLTDQKGSETRAPGRIEN
jgi:arylsulfatase